MRLSRQGRGIHQRLIVGLDLREANLKALGQNVHRLASPGAARSIQLGRASAPRLPHFRHRIRGPNDGTGTIRPGVNIDFCVGRVASPAIQGAAIIQPIAKRVLFVGLSSI
jgi:hypothetical protein